MAVVYGWAENRPDRLQGLAGDLARRRVAVIATGGPPPAFAVKAATSVHDRNRAAAEAAKSQKPVWDGQQ